MPIKSFRGLIANNIIDTIPLSTNNGSTGYKIKSLQLITNNPGDTDVDHVIKIYTIPQTAVDGTVDFSDQTLLAVGHYSGGNAQTEQPGETIVFDNVVFNQDIFVTHNDSAGTAKSCNYYIELEQVKLDIGENTVATLKDIRNIKSNQ